MLIGSNEMIIHSNLIFLLADVMDSLMMDTRSMMTQKGYELTFNAKRNFNAALHHLRLLRNSSVRHCQEDTQTSFANDSDMVYELTKLIIDRCGSDNKKVLEMYETIESWPSQCNMKRLNKSVFEFIKEDDKDEKEND